MNFYNKVKAIDLFCGAGGLTNGLKSSGINVVAGVDIDTSCQFPYEYNNKVPFIGKSISDINGRELNAYFKKDDIKVLVGCAPCQPFSTQTFKYKAAENHKDRYLLDEFLRLIKEIKPSIISMENVPAIVKQDIFLKFETELKNAGYKTSWKIVFCPKYGIPQNRRRLVFLASNFGDIKLIPYTHTDKNYITLKDVIYDLPKINAGEVDKSDPMHRACCLSKKNLLRIKSSLPGGTWRDWDESLLPNCYKKESGSGYTAVYGRASWDKPSATITTQFSLYGSGRFGHPEQNRAFSLREGALLQTFPKDYNFIEDTSNYSISKIKKHIGNAVPPKLAEIIGESIINHIGEHYGKQSI